MTGFIGTAIILVGIAVVVNLAAVVKVAGGTDTEKANSSLAANFAKRFIAPGYNITGSRQFSEQTVGGKYVQGER